MTQGNCHTEGYKVFPAQTADDWTKMAQTVQTGLAEPSTEDWSRHWKASEHVTPANTEFNPPKKDESSISNNLQGVKAPLPAMGKFVGYRTDHPLFAAQGVNEISKVISESFSHQPFTLVWNGKQYVPDFVPTEIEVTAYHQKDYTELYRAYERVQYTSKHVPLLKTQVQRLRDGQDALANDIEQEQLKNRAYITIWSAREYLIKTKRNNFETDEIFAKALNQMVNRDQLRKKYEQIYEDGRFKIHTEERSI